MLKARSAINHVAKKQNVINTRQEIVNHNSEHGAPPSYEN